MLKVGVTGGIGSGKSTIAEVFMQLGIPVYPSDIRAKELMSEDFELRRAIVDLFGNEAYASENLNRAFIASKVFSDQTLLLKLNELVHPAVKKDFDLWCSDQNAAYVLKEAAILIETGAYKAMDRMILVTAPSELKIQRVQNRDAVTRDEVFARMNRQWSDERKEEFADFVIHNDNHTMVLEQVLDIHKRLMKEFR